MKTIARLALAVLLAAACLPSLGANYLWEVSGLKNKVYLFGTVHAGRADWYPLPDEVERAFLESKVLVLEADVSDTAAMARYGNTMAYAAPDNLKAHVVPDDYERFRKLLPRYRFTEADVAQFKPFMAASLLVFAEWAREGFNVKEGVEPYLIKKARAEAKPIAELEGVDMQMRLMDSLSESEQRELFAGTLDALDSGLSGEQIKGLVKAWRAGDAEAMLQLARQYNDRVKGAKEFEELFIWSRHDDMVKKIEGYLNDSKERHFIAVGALHLAGPRGLVELLKKRGYVVRQL